MKKILFSLVALVCSMSMNAQIMRIVKNGVEVATYKGGEYGVEFEPEITGTAMRTGNVEVTWVQLWAGGPKFAEYNVGATSLTHGGGYYCWGGSVNRDAYSEYKSGTEALAGKDDTATKLWGTNWRMPTKEEFQGLLDNCNVVWTDNYNESGKSGCVFTGKGDYASNSVFLPASGNCYKGTNYGQNSYGDYWTSTPNGSNYAYGLNFNSGDQQVFSEVRGNGYSVRAVLAE